jgi:hypothetical protein
MKIRGKRIIGRHRTRWEYQLKRNLERRNTSWEEVIKQQMREGKDRWRFLSRTLSETREKKRGRFLFVNYFQLRFEINKTG